MEKGINNEFNIYTNPLSKEEFLKHELQNNIRKHPGKYHMIDVVRSLKANRPVECQKMMDEWIAMMELAPERGEPFSPEILGLVFGKGE